MISKFGFSVRELDFHDGGDIFNVLSEVMINRRKHISMVQKDERVLKGRIRFTFKKERYMAIGVFKGNILVGVALCNEEDDIPWIGHMYILKKHQKTKAFILLAYYLSNILFKDKPIRLDSPNTDQFKSVINQLPKQIGGQVITIDTAERLKKIMEK